MAERPIFKPTNPEKKQEILKDISFEKTDLPNGKTIYKSSAPDRKIAFLEETSAINPQPGVVYDVLIIKDETGQKKDPNDPTKKIPDPSAGKYIVRIVAEDGVPVKGTAGFEAPEMLTPIGVDENQGLVYVLETSIELVGKTGPKVPRAEDFLHFCLDKRTLETLEHLALGVSMRQPNLLEGETATSKTSSIEFLAMVTGNEVVRLNFNGQTDSSELIGKFVPNDGQLQLEFEQALKNPELLDDRAMKILEKANKEGRGLNMLESQKIAEILGIDIPDWRWQDGLIPEAMKKGQWVICDEINLGEPQIIERLNSVLEKIPNITLSENGGTKIGPGGDYPVHNDFRIFATMNPAEYEGRKPMSKAQKDRWTSYLNIPSPSEQDYADMLKLLVYGIQPDVEIRGIKYVGGAYKPKFEKLNQVPGLQGLLEKLAKFHTNLYNLSLTGKIGRDKKEAYTFTRRGLTEMMEFLEHASFLNRKTGKTSSFIKDPKGTFLRGIERYYKNRLPLNTEADLEDHKKVEDQLTAIGISSTTWTHDFKKAA